MDNIMDALITDRTQADVDRARYLNSLWDPRALQWRGTPQERAEWEAGPRGAYGFSDMNRVTQAAAYLIGALEELGYSVDVEDVTPAYNIRVSVDPAGGGVASGAGAYYEGDTATVTAQPSEKYDFAGWMENGQVVSESASYSFIVTGPRNLTAAFALKKFQVIASVDPVGSGEVTGAGTYDIDTEVTVAATAGDSYVFTRWAEAGETVSEAPQYTFILTENRTLSAVMTKTYVISVTASDTDGGTVSGGGIYLDGQTVTVAAVAGDGYEFTGWSENGSTVSTEAVYAFQAAADRSLVAVFVKTYVITLLVDPAGSGTTAGGGTVLDGSQVTVTATPGNGYRFAAWEEDGGQVSTNPSYTFTVTGNRTLTAVFEQVPIYTITATIDPDGSGAVTGAGQYQEGATVTLVATPADGYEFTGWQEGGEMVSTSATYSFTATGDRALVATCEEVGLLPAGYTQVEYIHTDGNAGIIASDSEIPREFSSMVTYIKFQFDSGVTSNKMYNLMGNSRSTSVNTKVSGQNKIWAKQYNSQYMYAYYGGGATTTGASLSTQIFVNANPFSTPFEITVSPSQNVFKLTNGSVTQTGDPKTGYDSATVGGGVTGLVGAMVSYYNGSTWTNTPSLPPAMKLYSIKFSTTGGTPIHDYIPCTNPSGVAGLYDVVSKKFWASTTGTAFTAGPAV